MGKEFKIDWDKLRVQSMFEKLVKLADEVGPIPVDELRKQFKSMFDDEWVQKYNSYLNEFNTDRFIDICDEFQDTYVLINPVILSREVEKQIVDDLRNGYRNGTIKNDTILNVDTMKLYLNTHYVNKYSDWDISCFTLTTEIDTTLFNRLSKPPHLV